jgi:hypothetical protein
MTATRTTTTEVRQPGAISISLKSGSWSSGNDHAAVVEIVPEAGERKYGAQTRTSLSVGINSPAQDVTVPPGNYTVRLYLPSGDILAESAYVLPGAKLDVVFELRPSPHEWLGANAAYGTVQKLPTAEHARALDDLRQNVELNVTSRRLRDGSRAGLESTAALSRMTQAVADVDRGFQAVESISGRANVDKISGVLELTRVDPDRSLEGERRTPQELVRWWAGAAEPNQQPLVRGDGDERNIVLSVGEPPAGDDFIRGTRRAFAVVRDPTGNWHYAVLPWGWARTSRSNLGSTADAQVLMTVGIDYVMQGSEDTGSPARWRCTPTVADVEAMSYLGFLYAGQRAATSVILDQARSFLFEKVVNPAAAAAGAYGLLSMDAQSNADRDKTWRDWVRNLYKWFPALPDGAIAMARMYVRYGDGNENEDIDVEHLRTLALEAVCRGMPYFTLGIRWLSEILLIVVRDDEEHKRAGAAVDRTQRAHRLVSQLLRLADTSQFFTSLDVGPERP